MTSTTHDSALAKMGSVSSTTVNPNAMTIATVYISAGFLGAASSQSSAPQDLLHAQSNAERLRDSSTTAVLCPMLHVINCIFDRLGK
jgi:hypothetical protein